MSKSAKNNNPKWKNIKLRDQSFEILKAYRTSGTDDDYIFPILDNSKDLDNPSTFDSEKGNKNAVINKLLKEIAQRAGIEQNLTFHIARHSFARYAASQEMSVYSISKALAHSDLKTTQVYLESFDVKLLDKEMDELFSSEE